MLPKDLTLADAFVRVFPSALMFDGARYLIATLVMMAVLWGIHRTSLRTRIIQNCRPVRADYVREIRASIFSLLVYAAVATPAFWAASNGYTAGEFKGSASGIVITAYVVLLLVAHDTWFYWTHRAMHHPRLFRAMHRLHHRSITPTPFAAYAFAWPEAVVQALFFALWFCLVPTPEFALFLFLAIMIVRNVMGHAGTELHPSGMADHRFWGLFNTTTHHDLHHSGGFNYNYGLYFTWWDRMMGTEHPGYREAFREVTERRPPVAEPASLQKA